jgi:hypothetical protein
MNDNWMDDPGRETVLMRRRTAERIGRFAELEREIKLAEIAEQRHAQPVIRKPRPRYMPRRAYRQNWQERREEYLRETGRLPDSRPLGARGAIEGGSEVVRGRKTRLKAQNAHLSRLRASFVRVIA